MAFLAVFPRMFLKFLLKNPKEVLQGIIAGIGFRVYVEADPVIWVGVDFWRYSKSFDLNCTRIFTILHNFIEKLLQVTILQFPWKFMLFSGSENSMKKYVKDPDKKILRNIISWLPYNDT